MKTPDHARDMGQTRRSAFLVATLASFLTPFMGSSVNVALPSIGRDFGMDPVELSWVATSFLLAAAVFLVPFGRIADMYGRKRIFVAGTIIFTLASFLCGISSTGAMLIAFRAVQGAGASMIFGTGMAILTSVFPPGERGRVLGYNVAAVYLGLSLGPFLGGFLTHQIGWSSVFFANVPFGVLIVLVSAWKLKGEWIGTPGEKFDLVGSLLYALALSSFMAGITRLPAIEGAGVAVLGVLLILLFVRWERRTTNPVLDVSLFHSNVVFAFSNLAALINYSATFAVTFLLSLYLQEIKGLDPQHAGSVLLAQPVLMALLSPLAGKLSDRIEPRVVASIGMGLAAAGLGMLSLIEAGTPTSFIVSSLVVLGSGFALFSSPNTNAVMSSVGPKEYGVASATLGTMRLTGQMLSMGVATLLLAVFVGRVKVTASLHPQFLDALRAAFLLFTILCIGGIFASLARGSVRGGDVSRRANQRGG
jgi:EmrB/QacA subfamily drug resistance transporter